MEREAVRVGGFPLQAPGDHASRRDVYSFGVRLPTGLGARCRWSISSTT
jgi:hypothetical protein